MGSKQTNDRSERHSDEPSYSFEQHYVFLSGHIVHLHEPLPIIRDLQSSCGKLSQEEGLKLELAMQEAIANAVEHGNLELSSSLRDEIDSEGMDCYAKLKQQRLKDHRYASRCVFISAFANEEEVKFQVRDEGKGFDGSSVATNIVETNLEMPKCSGRGLILIRDAADKVSFNEQGNQVEFIKFFRSGK